MDDTRQQQQQRAADTQVSNALAKMEAEWKAERQAMQQLLNDFKQTAITSTGLAEPPKPASNPSNRGVKPPAIKTKAPTKPIRTEPSSDYEEPQNVRQQTTTLPKPRNHNNSTNNNNKKKDVPPVETIMAPPKPATIPALSILSTNDTDTSITAQLLQTKKKSQQSPVKLWKPASFLPNVSKRPTDSTVENAPLLANLSFGMANAAAANPAKRIKLPTKTDGVGNGAVPVAGDAKAPSMFRSAVSANPLAADPSLLPSIIANFNVKIPPKAK